MMVYRPLGVMADVNNVHQEREYGDGVVLTTRVGLSEYCRFTLASHSGVPEGVV